MHKQKNIVPIESFNSRLRDELLNEALFTSLAQAPSVRAAFKDVTISSPLSASAISCRANPSIEVLADRHGRGAALCWGLRPRTGCFTEPIGLKYHRDSTYWRMKVGAQVTRLF